MCRRKSIYVALIPLICLWGCAQTTQIQKIKPRLLDQQFSAKNLFHKTVFILPFRDMMGTEIDFTYLESSLFDLGKDKFPETKWIGQKGIAEMENELDVTVLNAWHIFLDRYHNTGRIDTKNIASTVLKPQNIDYLLATTLTGHTVGAGWGRVYEYFAYIIFWDIEQKKFVYECTLEQVEKGIYDESIIEADRRIYRKAFYKMLGKIP